MTRVAVITGASSGIGEAAARELAADHRVVLVARREEPLRSLAAATGGSYVACDLTDADAPERVREHVRGLGMPLGLLVNNAGAGGRGAFADGGCEGVRRTMELNFDAQVRVTEALLPLLREAAPSAIVNVASTAARVSRPGVGRLLGEQGGAGRVVGRGSRSAEERPNGVHVGLVLPGFVATAGFPARELLASAATRWAVVAGRSGAPRRSATPAWAGGTSATCRAATPCTAVLRDARAVARPPRARAAAAGRLATRTARRTETGMRCEGRVSPGRCTTRGVETNTNPDGTPGVVRDVRPLGDGGGGLRARRRRGADGAVPPRGAVGGRRARDAGADRAGRRAEPRSPGTPSAVTMDAHPGAADGAARRARRVRGRARGGGLHARGGPRGARLRRELAFPLADLSAEALRAAFAA